MSEPFDSEDTRTLPKSLPTYQGYLLTAVHHFMKGRLQMFVKDEHRIRCYGTKEGFHFIVPLVGFNKVFPMQPDAEGIRQLQYDLVRLCELVSHL